MKKDKTISREWFYLGAFVAALLLTTIAVLVMDYEHQLKMSKLFTKNAHLQADLNAQLVKNAQLQQYNVNIANQCIREIEYWKGATNND